MNIFKKMMAALILCGSFATSQVYCDAQDFDAFDDEEESSLVQTVIDNKTTIACAVITAAVVSYLGYKYGASVVARIKGIFSKNDLAQKVAEGITKESNGLGSKTRGFNFNGGSGVYSGTYAQ